MKIVNILLLLLSMKNMSIILRLQVPMLMMSLSLLSPQTLALGKGGFKCSAGISKNICLKDDYSKFELPKPEGINVIYVSIDIDEVLRINDKDYSITFSTYFNVEWFENRLYVDPEFKKRANKIEAKGRIQKKKTDYLMTLIKRVGGYLAEITTS